MAVDKKHTNNTGVIILAAGESSRLGAPKQLLAYAGATLLQHSVEVAQASDADTVIVVLGANDVLINETLRLTTATIVVNPAWKEGMASAIHCGIQTLLKRKPQTETIILMVADQPFITIDLLNTLMEVNRDEQRSIVASNYGEAFGTPVLFGKRFFPELMQLAGDVGAKAIIRKHLKEAAFVPFPKGNIDIDTEQDYKNLSK